MKSYFKFFIFLLFCTNLQAQTLGTMADEFTNNQGRVIFLILELIAYIGGISLTIKGIVKFKENSDTKGQVKIKTAFMYLFAGAFLLVLPYMINIGVGILSLENAGGSDPILSKATPRLQY